jgi:hypothetical protein
MSRNYMKFEVLKAVKISSLKVEAYDPPKRRYLPSPHGVTTEKNNMDI